MTHSPAIPRDALLERLSAQVGAIQEHLRKAPKASAAKDVVAQFGAAVGSLYPGVRVEIAHLAAGAQGWDAAAKTAGSDPATRFAPAGDGAAEPLETADGIGLVLRLADGSRSGIWIGQSAPAGGWTAFDAATVRLFGQLFEGAYQEMLFRKNEKGLVFSMNHKILQLNSLIDTGIEVASLDFEASPHRLALARAASLANASRGSVRRLSGAEVREIHTFPEGAPPASNPAHRIGSSFTFGGETYAFELCDKESRAGIVPFDDTDQLLLDALARQVHAAIENRYLHQQALENQRLEQDMHVAATIQQKIIPVSLPKIPGYEIAGMNIPSKSIGGDYYDCIMMPDGRYALVVADVSGKGIPAALLVSSLHAYLSAFLEGTQSLPLLVARLNTMLYRDSTPEKFITAFIALLDPATGELECVNAGHNPSYVLGVDRKVRELRFGGLPLASFDLGIPYESERAVLAPGERLLLYTDGVTEAENERHELYEQSVSLEGLLATHADDSADAFITRLIADVKRFAGTAPQSDDITALCLHRLA
jgi:serine phosphatase RsbU (regulator of sigma subunit)